MKHFTLLFTILLVAIFAVGCEKSTNPVEVSFSDQSGVNSLAKATTVTTNLKVPISISVFIPCAGEFANLSGDLHILLLTILDGNGGFHTKFHFQPQGISGVGSVTGNKYQGTGVTQGQTNGTVGVETSFVNNFKIIGQGTGNNFLVHDNFHIKVHPDGTVTGFVDNFSVECK